MAEEKKEPWLNYLALTTVIFELKRDTSHIIVGINSADSICV